jgi:RNA polymerase sigma-19 factor, ECF subfamily
MGENMREAKISAASAFGLATAFVDVRRELVGFLSRRLLCRATAEDIAHDVYVRLSSSGITIQHPRQLIFKTAANLASNHGRNERLRAQIRHDVLSHQLSEQEECTPERAAIARDTLMRLAHELSRWPARTREVFLLNRGDGLTYREIVERLGVGSTTVERHMVSALCRLTDWQEREGL